MVFKKNTSKELARVWNFLKRKRFRAFSIVLFSFVGSGLLYLGSSLFPKGTLSAFLVSLGSAILATGLVTMTYEFYVSIQIVRIFALYKDFAQQGIERVFPEKNNEYWEIRKKHLDQANEVRVLTLLGRSYLENGDKLEKTKEMMKKKSEFKFMSLSPDCPHWNIQYDDFEPTDTDGDVVGRERKDFYKKSFDKLKNFSESLDNPQKVVRYFDIKPVFQLEFFDDYLFVAFYGLESRAKRDSPVLMFKKRKGSSSFQYFNEQFDFYWNRAGSKNFDG